MLIGASAIAGLPFGNLYSEKLILKGRRQAIFVSNLFILIGSGISMI